MSINSLSIIVGGFYLLLCSIYDIRYRLIPTKWIILGGILAGLWIVVVLFRGEWGYLLGSLIGMCLLVLGKVSGEKIGYGDGWIVMIVGVLCTFYISFIILMTALFFITAYGGMLICLKKVSHSFTLPFIPFYFVAYLLVQITWI